MLIIRLQRTGARNAPDFRLVLAEKHRAASKKVLAVLGQYNPVSKKFAVKDRSALQMWLDRNVELSPTVHNLLVTHKLMEGKKVKAWRPKIKEKAAPPAAVESPATATAGPAPAEEPKAEAKSQQN